MRMDTLTNADKIRCRRTVRMALSAVPFQALVARTHDSPCKVTVALGKGKTTKMSKIKIVIIQNCGCLRSPWCPENVHWCKTVVSNVSQKPRASVPSQTGGLGPVLGETQPGKNKWLFQKLWSEMLFFCLFVCFHH